MQDPRIHNTDALIVVDMQNDFLPGGALAAPEGDRIIPAINRAMAAFRGAGAPVYATRDWHPENHCSFEAQGGPWPVHCVRGSRGAEFAPGVEFPPLITIVSKATAREPDAYSGFQRTGLAEDLARRGVQRLFVCGVATEYCVHDTTEDAAKHGFPVAVLTDAIAAVNVTPGDDERALERLRDHAGAELTNVASLAAPA